MYIFKHIADILHFLSKAEQPVGFVPTMGALHEGHTSLVRKARNNNKTAVCSIFVNPTQFNDKNDYNKYPITIESDIEKLVSAGCDILFLPDVEEMYPHGMDNLPQYDLGNLNLIFDGPLRPGHFNGVCVIVDKLLNIVQPHNLYMGEKDFQQCMVVARLLNLTNSKTSLTICPTLREVDGLAMSSRNIRLSAQAREKAPTIYKCLMLVKENCRKSTFEELHKQCIQMLIENGFEVEYFSLAHSETLETLSNFDFSKSMVVLVAARIDNVRLIDNMTI